MKEFSMQPQERIRLLYLFNKVVTEQVRKDPIIGKRIQDESDKILRGDGDKHQFEGLSHIVDTNGKGA